jgi:hypothetical protein
MKSKMFALLGVSLFGLAIAYVVSNGSTSLSKQEDATPVQRGVMSAQQREHSKLYSKYNSERKISELIRKEKGDVEVYRLTPLGADLSTGPIESTSDILKRASCDADAVVVAVVEAKSPQLTEDESFIFTDYEVSVEQILKDNESAPILPSSRITVTRPGGTILLNNKTVRAVDESFPQLRLRQRYVLFIQFLPAIGTYRSIESGESFEVRGNDVERLKRDSVDRFKTEPNTNSLIRGITIAAANPCKRSKGGIK